MHVSAVDRETCTTLRKLNIIGDMALFWCWCRRFCSAAAAADVAFVVGRHLWNKNIFIIMHCIARALRTRTEYHSPTTSYIVSTTAQPFSFSIYANKLRRDGCAWRSHTPIHIHAMWISLSCYEVFPLLVVLLCIRFRHIASWHRTTCALNFRCAPQPISAISPIIAYGLRLRVGSLECNTMCKYYEIFAYSASRSISSLHAHFTMITNELSDIVANTQCLAHLSLPHHLHSARHCAASPKNERHPVSCDNQFNIFYRAEEDHDRIAWRDLVSTAATLPLLACRHTLRLCIAYSPLSPFSPFSPNPRWEIASKMRRRHRPFDQRALGHL